MADDIYDECLEAIDGMIKRGPLQGDGFDETAQRNGLVIAYNKIALLKERRLMRQEALGELVRWLAVASNMPPDELIRMMETRNG